MKKLFLLFYLLCPLLLHAQLGFTFYGEEGNDVIYQMTPAGNDEYYALGGPYRNTMEIWLAKFNGSGEIIWEQSYDASTATNTYEIGYRLLIADENTFYITGQNRHNLTSSSKAILIKTDSLGHQIWKKEYSDFPTFIELIQEGDHLLATSEDFWSGLIIRIDTSGNILSSVEHNVSDQTYIHKVIPTNDGNFILVGRANVIGAGYRGYFFRKITPTGDVLWTKWKDIYADESAFEDITELFQSTMGIVLEEDGTIWFTTPVSNGSGIGLYQYDLEGTLLKEFHYPESSKRQFPTSLLKTMDGGFLISGSMTNDSMFALKVGSSGKQEWRAYYGYDFTKSISMTSFETIDHYILGGTYQSNVITDSDYDGFLFRLEKNGNAYPFTVKGHVLFDKNKNCIADAEDVPLSEWFISALHNNSTELILSGHDGNFEFKTSSNHAELQVIVPQDSLWTICAETIAVDFNVNPEQTIDFLALPEKICSAIEVSLTQPDFVKCNTSCIIATMINHGNIASDAHVLQINWDQELSLVSSSWPYDLVDNGIDIEIPVMPPQKEERIELCVSLDCDVQLGATHQMEAIIKPIECDEPYTGPFYEVKGWCDAEEVIFEIRNTGDVSASTTTYYAVYINELLVSENIELNFPQGKGSRVITFPADGRTWRIEVQQDPDVPYIDHPSTSIEACGSRITGLHDIGLRNAFPSNDAGAHRSIILAANSTGVDNKVAEARHGFGFFNIIMETGELEYTARIKNDLPTVVQEVVFDLTLSPTIETKSFRLLSSNVTASVTITDKHNLRVVMNNLNLAPGQFAMVRFRVATVPGLTPNSNDSQLEVNCQAFLDEHGPFTLIQSFHTYAQFEQEEYEAFGVYPEYMHMYGGRQIDYGDVVIESDDGSLLLAGSTSCFGTEQYLSGYVYKTDLNGKIKWQTIIPMDVPGEVVIRGIQPDGTGGCIFTGEFLPQADAPNWPYPFFYYAVIGRIDTDGNVVWTKLIRPLGDQFGGYANGLIKTVDDQYIAFGRVDVDDFERFYIKFNRDGETVWVKQHSFYKLDPYEGVPLPDGGAYFVGTLLNTWSYPFPIVQRIDATGKILWENTIATGGDAYAYNIALSDDGGFVLGGTFLTEKNGESVEVPIIIKCDSAGNKQWLEKPELGLDIKRFQITGIEKAKDEGYLLTGGIVVDSLSNDYDVILIKVDDEGLLMWYKIMGGIRDEIAYDLVSPATDAIYLFGNDQREPLLFDLQSFLIKTNGEGVITSVHDPQIPSSTIYTLLFPNPANEHINIVLSPKPGAQVNWTICDMMGRVLLQGKGEANDFFQVNTTYLASGSYVITFPGTRYPGQVLMITD